MSITSSRVIQIQYSGDTTLELIQSALDNDAASGDSYIVTLVSGPNNIAPPIVVGLDIKGLTIIPPSANTVIILLKGSSGDDGIPLHLTDPTSIGLGDSFSQLILDAASEVVGVRLIWT